MSWAAKTKAPISMSKAVAVMPRLQAVLAVLASPVIVTVMQVAGSRSPSQFQFNLELHTKIVRWSFTDSIELL